MALTLEIVTPEARVYSDTIDSVVIPTVEGELRVTKGSATQLLAVGGGFAQIVADKISILAESAITEEKIDEAAVEKAMQRAEEALKGKDSMDPAEIERLESFVRSSVAQLGLKRRRR